MTTYLLTMSKTTMTDDADVGGGGVAGCEKTGRTLLHLISMEANPMTELKYVPILYILSNAGLDLDLQDNDGLTPLQLSIRSWLVLASYVWLRFCLSVCLPGWLIGCWVVCLLGCLSLCMAVCLYMAVRVCLNVCLLG